MSVITQNTLSIIEYVYAINSLATPQQLHSKSLATPQNILATN